MNYWELRPSILLKDFPGSATCGSQEEYLSKYLSNDDCHTYVVFYTERITYSEIELVKLIKTQLRKRAILVRSKADDDIENLKIDDENLSDDDLFKKLKIDIANEIKNQEFNRLFDSTFSISDLKVFSVSTKAGNEKKFEMNDLLNEIFNFLPDELDEENANEMPNIFLLESAKEEFKKIRINLEKRILTLAFLSAASDIFPIGGQIADLAIIIGECKRYKKYFCLNKAYINELGKKYKIDEKEIGNILKKVAFDAKYLSIKDFALGLLSASSIGYKYARGVLGAVALNINILTLGIGCVVSACITGPLSFILCKSVLNKALDQMESDALKIIEEIHKQLKQE